MDKLRAAVKAGIISDAQRRAIEALDATDPRAFRLSVVHVLWAGGVALIVFALWLLALEISQGQAWVLTLVCLAYAGVLTGLDWVVSGRSGLRLLSCLIVVGIAACLCFAVLSWQEAVGGHYAFVPWSSEPYPWRRESGTSPLLPFHPLIHGVYLPLIPVVSLSIALIRRRGFLPVWMALAGAFVLVLMDFQQGLPVNDVEDTAVLLFASAVLAGVGWWCDLNLSANHGFWINKAAMSVFWVYSVVALFETPSVVLLLASLLAIAFSIFLRRPAGISAGALGVALYLGDWLQAWDDLYTAAALLAVIGVGAIFLGVRAHLIEARLDGMLPKRLRDLRPETRNDPVTFGF